MINSEVFDNEGNLQNTYNKFALTKQKIITQYEEIIQSFDYGILNMCGILSTATNLSFKYLNKDVLFPITFDDINSRKIIDMWEWIIDLHIQKNINEKEIHDIVNKCKNEFEAYIINDEDGIMFSSSPYLIMLKGMMHLQYHELIEELIITIPEKYTKPCKDTFYKLMMKFFTLSRTCPVGIEEYSGDYYTCVKNLSKTKKEDFTVITGEITVMNKLLLEDKLSNITFIYPDISRMNISEEKNTLINVLFPFVEFIPYKQSGYTPSIK